MRLREEKRKKERKKERKQERKKERKIETTGQKYDVRISAIQGGHKKTQGKNIMACPIPYDGHNNSHFEF